MTLRPLFVYFVLLLFINYSYGIEYDYNIPFKEVKNRIFITGKINGKNCQLMYDTGAIGISIDSDFINKKNFHSKKSIVSISLADKYNRILTSQNNIRILDINKYDILAIHSAVIGLDFFNNYIVEINYSNCNLILSRKRNVAIENGNFIRLTKSINNLYTYGLFTIKGKIVICDSIIEGNFLIDTGSSRYVTLLNYPDENLKRITDNLINNKKYINVQMTNAHMSGFKNFYLTKESKLYFGKVVYDNLLVDISDVSINNFPKNDFIGIIGGGILKNFKIFIDYSNDFLILKNENNDIEIGEELITDGFRISTRKKKVIVSTVFKNKKTLSKIILGDEIIEADNIPIRKVDFEELKKKKMDLGRTITYRIKRGGNIFEIETKVKDMVLYLIDSTSN